MVSRDVVVGLRLGSEARAYPLQTIFEAKPDQDRLGGGQSDTRGRLGPAWGVGESVLKLD